MSELPEDNNYIHRIPPAPELLTQIFECIKGGGNIVEEMANEISKYKEVEEIVLKLANSRYFSFGQEIKTIQKAIVFLGIMRTKNIILVLSTINIYCPNDYKKFFKHSLMCALASKSISEQLKTINPDDAFAIGYLHDIGKLALYGDLEKDTENTNIYLNNDIIETENETFQTNHCAVGA